MSKKTKRITKDAILLNMLRHGPITSYEIVLQLPTTAPSRLVHRLREKGFGIFTEEMVPENGGKTYAKYHLVSEPPYKHQMEMFAYE